MDNVHVTDSAQNTDGAVDSAARSAEGVKRVTALVRSVANNLREPLPMRTRSLEKDLLWPMRAVLQDQSAMLDFNPLVAKPLAVVVADVQQAAAAQVAVAQTLAQVEMIKAVMAAAAKTQKSKAAGSSPSAKSASSTAQDVRAHEQKTAATSRKFSLVKPSLQDVGAQIASAVEQSLQNIVPGPVTHLAHDVVDSARQNFAIAPRVASAHAQSAPAMLAALLKQLQQAVTTTVAALPFAGSVSDLVTASVAPDKKSSGAQQTSDHSVRASLAQLGQLANEVFQQGATEGVNKSSVKTSRTTNRPTGQATVALPAAPMAGGSPQPRELVSPLISGAVVGAQASVAGTAFCAAGGTTAATQAEDGYALAEMLNDVLREQAWLAGVDLT